MLSKSFFFVTCLLIANGAMGQTGQLEINTLPGPAPLLATRNGGGFLGTLLFGVTLDQFGGTSQPGAWILSFGTCGLACLAGVAATIFLSRDVWQRRP
jgi:hypothetical protein